MAVKDLIISFFAGSPLLSTKLKQLQHDYILFEPQVSGRQYQQFVSNAGGSVIGLFGKAMKQGDTIGRVALIGFSEGCQGVSAVLNCSDASAIDAVIPIDGIHRQFSDPLHLTLNPATLSNYLAFAKLAAQTPPSVDPNGKLMVISHSSIGAASLPAGMASTTQTANLIYQEITSNNPPPVIETQGCGWYCPAAVHLSNLASIVWPNADLPIGTTLPGATITQAGWTTVRPTAPESGNLPPATFSWSGFADGWIDRRVVNNFYIFGWGYDTPNKTKDPTGNRDHVFQAQMVLPAVAAEMLVKRWNPSCTSGASTSGLGADMCTQGGGTAYGAQPKKQLPNDYQGIQIPALVETCPVPPPGRTIIGRPGDPCWTGEEVPSDFAKFLVSAGAAAGSAALGYYGARYLLRQCKKSSQR